MQKFKILVNNFSGSTLSASTIITGAADVSVAESVNVNVGQTPQLVNDYYVYTSQIGGFTVNDNNVRSFLDDERNSGIAESFVEYMKTNTSIEEFRDIFYDNKKLASVFNGYYKENILSSLISEQTSSQIDSATRLSKEKQAESFNFNPNNNNRIINSYVMLDSNAMQNSYFVPIYVEQSRKLVEDGNYANYFKDCINETYIYKRYTFLNTVVNNVIYGNTAYINSIKDNYSIGYSPIEDDLFGNYSVGTIPNLDRDNFNFSFLSQSQFEYYFNYRPPIITTSFPGFFLSQNVVNINNTGTFNSNYGYGYGSGYGSGYGPQDFTASFNPNGLKFFDKTFSSTTVPITVQLSLPSVGTTYFTVRAENYSTATLGSDFIMQPASPNLNYRPVSIKNGEKSHTFPLTIHRNMEADESIILSLISGVTIIGFLIVRGEETIPVNNYSHAPSILIENETKNKLMLRCFVDYNFNDNESKFWHNKNITIINTDASESAERLSQIQNTENNLLINKVAATLKMLPKDIKNLFIYGSKLYGTSHAESDFDLIVVADVLMSHQNIVTDEFNIQLYSESKYTSDLQKNDFPAIEMLFIPDWAVIKRDFAPSVEISSARVAVAGIQSALENINQAKASANNSGLKYMVKKRIFHAYRKLLFTEQLIRYKKITDFKAADEFRNTLPSYTINSKEDIVKLIQPKIDAKINEINALKLTYK